MLFWVDESLVMHFCNVTVSFSPCMCRTWRDYEPVCVGRSSLRCDFTDNVAFGLYKLRVRTELHGETSDWVETGEFAVDKISESLHF